MNHGSLDAAEIRPREYFSFGDAVLPTDAKDSSEPRLLELLQAFDIPTIHGACIASV